MKRSALLLLFVLLFMPLAVASSPDLEITKVDKGSVVISELNNPAVFDFVINNKGYSDNFEIYSLVGVSMGPRGMFEIPSGTSTVHVEAYPNADIRKRPGFFIFDYQLRGQQAGIYNDKLQIKIVSLSDIFSIKIGNVNVGDKKADVTVVNVENTNLNDVKINVKSAFFDADKVISLGPYGNVTFSVDISDKINKLVAGPYIVTAGVVLDNANTKISGVVNYLEKEGFSVNSNSSGFIVRRNTMEKRNEGNVPANAKIEMSRDIITRLFTSYSIEPTNAERHWLYVTYVWEKGINPGEALVVVARTNYTLPFVLIILIVLVTLLAKTYSQTNLILNKRVSFVKTKGGEFALKIRLHVKARKYVNNVQVIDRLPGMTKLYEEFGIKPDKIDESSRRLFWNIPRLNAGEERVFSYIIYSKLNVVGRFELPAAMGIYEFDGKTFEAWSNRTFFVSETDKTED